MRMIYRLVRIGLLVSALGVFVSCVDKQYDFNNLDPEITLGGEDLKINIGSTKKFRLGDIVSSLGGLKSNDDGSYGVVIGTDPVNVSLEGLKRIKANVSVDNSLSSLNDISVFMATVPEIDADTFAAMSEEIDLGDRLQPSYTAETLSHEVDIRFKGLPKEIVSLKDVKLSEGAKLRVTVSAPDCILTGGSLVPDLSVDITRLFDVGNSAGIHFSGVELNPSNGFKSEMDFPLYGLVIGPDSFDASTRTLTLKDNVSVKGEVSLNNPKTTKTRYLQADKNIRLKVTVEVLGVSVEALTGGFEYSVSNIQTTFTLGGLFGGFDFDSAVLDFSNPTLDLVVDTNLGVPVTADIEFVPIKGGNELDTKVLSTIEIPAVPDPSDPKKFVYHFSKSGEPEGENVGVKADLPALLRTIPDVVKINIAAVTDKASDGTIILGKNYDMSVKMDVNVPMSFGKDLRIDYRDTVKFSLTGMETLLNSNTLVLGGLLDNSMPLDYKLSVDLVDYQYRPIAATMTQEVKADSKTDLNMVLKKDESSTGVSMYALILCFSLTSGSDNAKLNEDNYIQASDLTLGMPGGLTLKLGK